MFRAPQLLYVPGHTTLPENCPEKSFQSLTLIFYIPRSAIIVWTIPFLTTLVQQASGPGKTGLQTAFQIVQQASRHPVYTVQQAPGHTITWTIRTSRAHVCLVQQPPGHTNNWTIRTSNKPPAPGKLPSNKHFQTSLQTAFPDNPPDSLFSRYRRPLVCPRARRAEGPLCVCHGLGFLEQDQERLPESWSRHRQGSQVGQ